MKIIYSPKEFEVALLESMQNYNYFDWAVAWATANETAPFIYLTKHKKKIRNIYISLFNENQELITDKGFINEFKGKICFVDNAGGKCGIHSKLYFFENCKEDWCCYIGSANFTKSGLEDNFEVIIQISSDDRGSINFHERIVKYFKRILDFHKDNLIQIYSDNELDSLLRSRD